MKGIVHGKGDKASLLTKVDTGYKNNVSADDLVPSEPGHVQLQW